MLHLATEQAEAGAGRYSPCSGRRWGGSCWREARCWRGRISDPLWICWSAGHSAWLAGTACLLPRPPRTGGSPARSCAGGNAGTALWPGAPAPARPRRLVSALDRCRMMIFWTSLCGAFPRVFGWASSGAHPWLRFQVAGPGDQLEELWAQKKTLAASPRHTMYNSRLLVVPLILRQNRHHCIKYW